MPPHSTVRAGIRAGLPLAVPVFALAVSFGVVARPVMGSAAPIVMSFVVYAGAAQFAALSVLAAGGGAAAAIVAGLLMNLRFLPMGLAAAPSLSGSRLARALQGQTLVDASWAMASRRDGTFDRGILIGSSVPQYIAWTTGTIAGVLAGSLIKHPERFGLDAIFPAFYLALLVGELRHGRARGAAALGGLIALALLPVAPGGVPVLAASAAALTGLRRR
jgi:4-azaleucine resistance transporter AzlC